jgi:hypothetical protein
MSRHKKRRSEDYYYVQGKKMKVSKRNGLIAVKFRSRADSEKISAFGRSQGTNLRAVDQFKELQKGNLRIYKVARGHSDDVRALPQDIRQEDDIEKVGEVYVNEYNQPLILTDEIVCKFKPMMTVDQIERLEDSYGLKTAQRIGFSENTYVLTVKPEAKRNALEIASDLMEEGHADFCYPNWIESLPPRQRVVEVRHGIHPTDPNFGLQWHLENTGQGGGTPGADIQATLAWQVTMGNPTLILSVIDGGVDIAHNDLNAPGKILAPIDLTVTPPDNNPLGGSHGTEVAGMAVGTANNGCAGAGSAPNCRLMPIKVSTGDAVGTQVQFANAFRYAADNGASAITCSLGPVGPWTMTDLLRVAIDYATTYGRNGLGCVYTQAVDNASNPINIDQVSAYERSIAVSRTTNMDLYNGAATGPELDLCAPGVNVFTVTNTTTTDTCTNITRTGTSYATPLTAGVDCLVLSVNPNLSWEEARQILLDSADKIDAAANPYNPAPAGRPPGTRNDRYGYGRVNANRAVQLGMMGSARDLFIRDSISDTGDVPQPQWGFWDSPDIWVRNIDDNGTTHLNTIRGQDNFIYARVSNRGSQASLPCWVRFFITTFAGTEFRYPYDFKRDTTMDVGGGTPGNLKDLSGFPAPGTYFIGEQRIDSVPATGNVIAKVRWPASLIPPATNWHPCILVEVSPHDGPNTATGEHIWENNNLGQKNISIVNAIRGTMVDFPFKFNHWEVKHPFVSLDILKVKAPSDLQLLLDVKDPKLLESISNIAGISIPTAPIALTGAVSEIGPAGIVGNVLSGIIPPNKLPWNITFLDRTRIAVESSGTRSEDEEALVFTFPAGSSIEFGREPLLSRIIASRPMSMGSIDEGQATTAALKPSFNIATVQGVNVLALNSDLESTKVKVPILQAGFKESSLKFKIPENAVPGESYVFDVAERDSKGQLVGGVRLQVNVVA